MRFGVVLLVLVLLSPLVGAEEVRDRVFEDGSEDVTIGTQDGTTSVADPTGAYANVDVVGGGVWAEDDDAVTFYIVVDDLTEDSQAPLPLSDPDYYLYFHHGDQGYRVFVATALENPFNGAINRDTGAFGQLQVDVGFGRYRAIEEATVEMDYDNEVVLMTVPRAALADENQAPLPQNGTLSGIYVESRSMGWFGFPVYAGSEDPINVGIPMASDRAPDQGTGSHKMATGSVQQRGSLFAVSPDPVRWTNGEATTLSFQVTVTNLGAKDLPVAVSTKDLDPSWEVAYSDRITVPAGGFANATFLVTIPFSHQHGHTKLFQAVFESDDGADAATALMGIHWPAVPQPAGHHDTLWVHGVPNEIPAPFDTLAGSVHAWFSALEEPEEDQGLPAPASFTSAQTPGEGGSATWYLPLEPQLRMGLDLEPDRTGTMEVGMILPVPVVDPYVEVTLLHSVGSDRRGQQWQPLVTGTSEVQSGAVNGGTDFVVELGVVPGVDDIPYDPEANLILQVELKATLLVGGAFVNPGAVTPQLDPATSVLRLPLNEYHDPADLSFQTDASVTITAGEMGQERRINPGRTLLYTFDLDFDGMAPTGFDVALSGRNTEWAQVIGDTSFQLEPGTTRTLALSVTAPEDARDGEQADITLTVTSRQNAAVQAGIGTLTTVTTTQDVPDESTQAQELDGDLSTTRDAPGLPLVLLILALLVVVRQTKE